MHDRMTELYTLLRARLFASGANRHILHLKD
jgi:hypothetical protein